MLAWVLFLLMCETVCLQQSWPMYVLDEGTDVSSGPEDTVNRITGSSGDVGNIKSHDPFFALWSIPKTKSTGETEVTVHCTPPQQHNTHTPTVATTRK